MAHYTPNFDKPCYVCSAKPTVRVEDHEHGVPDTELCGPHFFLDRTMSDWEMWNNQREDTE